MTREMELWLDAIAESEVDFSAETLESYWKEENKINEQMKKDLEETEGQLTLSAESMRERFTI